MLCTATECCHKGLISPSVICPSVWHSSRSDGGQYFYKGCRRLSSSKISQPWKIIPMMPTNSGPHNNKPKRLWTRSSYPLSTLPISFLDSCESGNVRLHPVGREWWGDLGQRWETGLRTPDGQRKAVCGLSGSCWTLPTHIRRRHHTQVHIADTPHISSHSPRLCAEITECFFATSSQHVLLRQCHGLRQHDLWNYTCHVTKHSFSVLPQWVTVFNTKHFTCKF